MNLSKKITAIALATVTMSAICSAVVANGNVFDLTRATGIKESVGTSTTYSAHLQLKADYEQTTTNFIYSENKYAIPGTGTLYLEWTEGNSEAFSISTGEKYLGMNSSSNTFFESNSPVLWKPTVEGIRTTYNGVAKFLYYNNEYTRVAPYTSKKTNNGDLAQGYSIAYFYNEADFLQWDSHCEGSFARQCLYNLAYGVAITQYTISFDANGGTGTMSPVSVEEGLAYSLPGCDFTAPTGKEFDYWSIGNDRQDGSVIVNNNITLQANWKNKTTGNVSTLTFTAKCNGSGTADNGIVWTVSSDGAESAFDSNKGIHYGTGSAAVSYIRLSTTGISTTITKIIVNASVASGVTATVAITIGGNDFGGNPKSLTTSATNYTFEGSASGTIQVEIKKPSSATKALYCKSITVYYQ